MNMHVRKIYLHLDHPRQNVEIRIGSLNAQVRRQNSGCTHYLHFTYNGMYSRVWVNLPAIKVRRDLRGIYLMDFREDHMNDRLICTREGRNHALLIRPDVGFCQWREEDGDY